MAKTTLRLSFNPRLYSAGAIKKSIDDYSEVADCTIENRKGCILVSLCNFDTALSRTLGDEFANYVLFQEGIIRSW